MEKLVQSDIRQYGILALPLAVAGLPLYLHAPDFYVTEQQLSLGLIGAILLFVRILDAVQDPLIGLVSDRMSARRPFILTGIAGLSVGLLGLFMPPSQAGPVWFALWIIVATTSYSLISINLNALGGIWSRERYERTRIATTRERFTLIGVTAGVVIPGVLTVQFGKPVAFATFSMAMTLLLLWCAWQFIRWSGRHKRLFAFHLRETGIRQLTSIAGDTRIRRLMGITLMGSLASSLPAVLFLFFVRDQLQAESLSWLFLMLYFFAALGGISLWRDLSRRQGKVRTWCLTMLVAVASFVAAIFTGPGDLWIYGIVCLATGFALGGDLIFPASLLADYVGNDDDSSARAGTGYAWLSFVQKASLGVSAGVAFPVLGAIGFTTGSLNEPHALFGLVILYAGVPLILKLLAAWLAWSWRDSLEDLISHEKTNHHINHGRDPGHGPDTDKVLQPNEN